mgnify:CR=1 FL=1
MYSSTTPSLGNYVGNPIVGLITGTPAGAGTVYVTTSQCDSGPTGPISGCQPFLFPVDIKTNAPGFEHDPPQFSQLAHLLPFTWDDKWAESRGPEGVSGLVQPASSCSARAARPRRVPSRS